MSPKGPPLSFLLFCYRMRVYKSKRGPPFTFFRHCATFSERIFFQKFQVFFQKNVLRFLSLRYSADLRRSRLVLQLKPECERMRETLNKNTISLPVQNIKEIVFCIFLSYFSDSRVFSGFITPLRNLFFLFLKNCFILEVVTIFKKIQSSGINLKIDVIFLSLC